MVDPRQDGLEWLLTTADVAMHADDLERFGLRRNEPNNKGITQAQARQHLSSLAQNPISLREIFTSPLPNLNPS
jgi:hypothetical protein